MPSSHPGSPSPGAAWYLWGGLGWAGIPRPAPAWPIAVACSPPCRVVIPSDIDFELRGPCRAGKQLGDPTGIPAHPSPPPLGPHRTWGGAAGLAGGGLTPAVRMPKGQRKRQSFSRKMLQNARPAPAWPIPVACSPPCRGVILSDLDFELRGPCRAGRQLGAPIGIPAHPSPPPMGPHRTWGGAAGLAGGRSDTGRQNAERAAKDQVIFAKKRCRTHGPHQLGP
jgi:hypothetical protein